jgi:hypothetical protein
MQHHYPSHQHHQTLLGHRVLSIILALLTICVLHLASRNIGEENEKPGKFCWHQIQPGRTLQYNPCFNGFQCVPPRSISRLASSKFDPYDSTGGGQTSSHRRSHGRALFGVKPDENTVDQRLRGNTHDAPRLSLKDSCCGQLRHAWQAFSL